MTTRNRFSILALMLAIALGGAVDFHTLGTPGGVFSSTGTPDTGTETGTEWPRCFEDELRVIVVAQVQPDPGNLSGGLTWGPGDLTGTRLCIARDDYFSGEERGE